MPSEHEKYYKILDLDVEASKEEVQNAFKELSLIWHPDNHSDKSPEVQSRSTEKFKELSNAYEVLTKYLSEEDSSNEAEEKKSQETEKPRRDALERKNPRRPWIEGANHGESYRSNIRRNRSKKQKPTLSNLYSTQIKKVYREVAQENI